MRSRPSSADRRLPLTRRGLALLIRRNLGGMIAAILRAGPCDHRERVVDGHPVRVGRALHDFVCDVHVGLAHVVMSTHAATVQAHREFPFFDCGISGSLTRIRSFETRSATILACLRRDDPIWPTPATTDPPPTIVAAAGPIRSGLPCRDDRDAGGCLCALHDATPAGWRVGRPYHHQERRQWHQYAFDPSERPLVGLRSREWTAIGSSELEVVREMAQCLAKIKEGGPPR